MISKILKKLLLFVLLSLGLQSFAQQEKLISYQWLNFKTTEIFLGDFVLDVSKIDSVVLDSRPIKLPVAKDKITITSNQQTKAIQILSIWQQKKCTNVVLKKSLKQTLTYSFNPKGKAYKTVLLKGEFNGWTASKNPLKFENGKWSTNLTLNPGNYQFVLVVNGKEINDPELTTISNGMGGKNSLLVVAESKKAKPQLITKNYRENDVFIAIKNNFEKVFVLFQNTLMPPKNYTFVDGFLKITIPADQAIYEKSYLRIIAYNEAGLSNDILIPLNKGKVVGSTDELNRHDPYKQILYNVFVDRFFNGNPSNDRPLNENLVLPKANYMGGDVEGVIEKMNEGYFQNLGVNTLWLSPLVKNPEGAFGKWDNPKTKFSAYHGYWPISFTQMDDRLGTPSSLKNLVNTAHQNETNILLDFVAHHVHQEHPLYKQHPDWTTSLYLPDGSLNTERWDEYRLTTWFDVFLPTLNLEKKEVTQMLSDSALWWLKEYQLDGFRHDATKHVPIVFWRTLSKKINAEIELKENRPIYQVGETYGSVDLINSYVSSGLLDGQFDFNVYDAALQSFAKGEVFDNLKYRLSESMQNYGSHNLMCYITGNQDRGRFISYAGGALSFEEDAKVAGWTRDIEVGEPIGYDRLCLLMAFNMTIPGLPVIYYGDEIGMPGGNDPDSRRMMKFGNELNDLEQKMLDNTKRLTALRKNNMALIYGDFNWLNSEDKMLAYSRKYFDNVVVVIINNANRPQSFTLDVSEAYDITKFSAFLGNEITHNPQSISVELPANSYEVLIAN